jgi:hypothetical protein
MTNEVMLIFSFLGARLKDTDSFPESLSLMSCLMKVIFIFYFPPRTLKFFHIFEYIKYTEGYKRIKLFLEDALSGGTFFLF